MKEGVNPEPKLHGSFVGRSVGSWLWESDGFIVFVSCDRMAAVVNLRSLATVHSIRCLHSVSASRAIRAIAGRTLVDQLARRRAQLRQPQLGGLLQRKHSEPARRILT